MAKGRPVSCICEGSLVLFQRWRRKREGKLVRIVRMKATLRKLLEVMAFVCAVILVAGCSSAAQPTGGGEAQAEDTPRRGGVLALATDNDPPSFDMHQESTTGMQNIIAPAYDSLVMFDPKDPKTVVGDLAEKWELAPDGKTYTFYMRKGVQFHNGNRFTAEDAKFSLDRMRDPPKGVRSPRKGIFDAVERVEATDDYTLKVFVKRPNPSLIANLAMGWISMYDKEWVEEKGQDRPLKEVNGTGPFKFKSFTAGVAAEVERNPNYWMPDRPYLDGVKKFTIPDSGTRIAAVRAGQVHMLTIPFGQLKSFEEMQGFTIQEVGGTTFSTINMNATREPFSDARVRQAVMLAIDRKAAIQILSEGDADVGGYLPPKGRWTLPAAELAKLPGYGPDKAADFAQAKKLMAESGHASGFSTTITSEAAHESLDTVVADQLGKIGIKVNIKVETSALAYDIAANKDFALLPWGHAVSQDDPDAIYAEFYTCNAARNYSGICSKEVDDLFLKQSQTLDPSERAKLVLDVERKAVALGGKIVLQWGRTHWGVWGYVHDYTRPMSSYANQKQRDVWMAQ